jgi:hypothetical protein
MQTGGLGCLRRCGDFILGYNAKCGVHDSIERVHGEHFEMYEKAFFRNPHALRDQP